MEYLKDIVVVIVLVGLLAFMCFILTQPGWIGTR